MNNSCRNCGATIRGRIDKKFCDDSCRSAFHNQVNGEMTSVMRNTHRMLRRNWKILTRHFNRGEYVLDYDRIHQEGFNANLVTGYVLEESRIKYRCYEYTFELSPDGCVRFDKYNLKDYEVGE